MERSQETEVDRPNSVSVHGAVELNVPQGTPTRNRCMRKRRHDYMFNWNSQQLTVLTENSGYRRQPVYILQSS
ncbi:hypothetical protein AVEN_242274-1, partial [Araneus ventricosus]